MAEAKRIVNGLCQFRCIAMALDMHVHRRWCGSKQVVVEGRDLDATLRKALHHRIDLLVGEDKIAHYHRALVGLHKRQPGPERERGFDRDAI